MKDGWDYDSCFDCRNFSTSITTKGRQWRCKLNNSNTAEKRAFRMIWALDFIINHGALSDKYLCSVTVNYVGKNKKKQAKGER
jgi:hypothetical protein